ncbi:hypothetical protein F4820DRAFT_136211 [Hypoxylon rubiginosum]|uniref:Uncharacterized protein n=1 Tax=Hypoxylon rubiginosum TaxID=110542 RepID=A0ACB9ZAG7_9PEZI|nr:hypothetical protein F4820DRAFT_136211 [Hypoxylon rubiginosum]
MVSRGSKRRRSCLVIRQNRGTLILGQRICANAASVILPITPSYSIYYTTVTQGGPTSPFEALLGCATITGVHIIRQRALPSRIVKRHSQLVIRLERREGFCKVKVRASVVVVERLVYFVGSKCRDDAGASFRRNTPRGSRRFFIFPYLPPFCPPYAVLGYMLTPTCGEE